MELLTDLQPSPTDSRDRIASLPLVGSLPSQIDLKPYVFEVENQLTFSSCTANAGCSALELMYNKNKTPVDLSRMFLYFFTRQLGNLKGDVGAFPRDIGKALKTYGVCYEKSWDYIAENLNLQPTADVIKEAETFKILSYEQIIGDKLPQIKSALAQNIPVLLTIQVHDGFFKLGKKWQEHSWNWTTSVANPLKGWHQVLIIGYDDACQRLLVENSWGPGWGDGGFFGIPYGMVNTQAFGELWILTPNTAFEWKKDLLETVTPKKTSNLFKIIFFVFLALVIYVINFR